MSNLNFSQIIQIAEKLGLQSIEAGLPVMVEVHLLANPGESMSEVETEVAGAIKHQMRGKLGWFVDFIFPYIQQAIEDEIGKAYQTVINTPVSPATAIATPPLVV